MKEQRKHWLRKVPGLGPLWEKMDGVQIQVAGLQEEITALSAQLSKARSPTGSLVFFHLSKTGGSSIWSTLHRLASQAAIPILDLYHVARYNHHEVRALYKVLMEHREMLREGRILLHHHTPHPIDLFLEPTPLYVTVVRDPVDRFISDVNHVRAVLQGDWDEVHLQGAIHPKDDQWGKGWSRDLVERAASDRVPFEELLESAAREEFVRRYYYWSFYHLLCGSPQSRLEFSSFLPLSVKELAIRVKAKFAYIGQFPQVFQSFCEIARVFEIPHGFSAADFPHMLQRQSTALIPERRVAFREAFKDDYELLSRLGFDFSGL
jgi:hypothetical protein